MPRLLCGAVLALCALASAASAMDINEAIRRALPSPHALRELAHYAHTSATRAGSRSLLATASQCVWQSSSCDLNADFVTGLGDPSTDSQKLLAYAAVLNNNCTKSTTRTACIGKCSWDSSVNMCYLSDTFFDLQWLRGTAFCSGSLMDKGITCGSYITSSTCGGNGDCFWTALSTSASASTNSSAASAAATVDLSGITELFSGYGGINPTVNGGTCNAKWTTDATTIQNLVTKMLSSMSTLNVTTGDGASSILEPLFDDLFGTCSGAQKFRTLLFKCPTLTGRANCTATTGCEWSGTTTYGSCDLSGSNFAEALLFDPTDTWVKSYTAATTTCSNATSSTSCGAVGTITVDTTKYSANSTFAKAQPSYVAGGAAGMVAVSSLVSLMAGLLAFVFLF